MKYADATKKYDVVFGLETHVELSTNTKLFCPAHIEFGGEPNTELTPVSLGLPGSLPVINKTAVDYAIKLGLALHCEIAEWSQFARKNYFYPDMPRDYQISQYDKPTNGNGYLDVELEDGTIFRVPIERAHIEDDAGKNTHVGGADGRIEGADHSLVDYNRAGVPLIEIVTKPIEGAGDRAPEIAGAYMRAIRDIVRALNISHARMEQGTLVFPTGERFTRDNWRTIPDGPVKVSVRPEEFVVHHADEKAGGLSAVLEDSVYLGLNTHYYLKLTGGASVELIQESAIDEKLEPGSAVTLTLKEEKINIFSEDGTKNYLRG